ncbi:hypothetical protein QOZ80_2BG0202980 [Eleusine coracana subsp. coracana]|nr:hypothetical protein QOZ80_2BG0202980 [Eleusine coracana subsp. coracana]
MALHSYDCCVFPPQLDWSWDWDLQLHTLGVGEAGDAELQDEATFFQAAPGVDSPVSSEASSGYLQDAVAHWNVDSCNKRQRTAATPPPRRPAGVNEDLQFLLESFWDPCTEGEDISHDLKTTIIPEMSCSFVSEEDVADASGREEQRVPSTQTQVSAAQGREEARRSNAVRAAAPLQKATTAAERRDDRLRPGVHCWEPSRAAATTSTTMLGASCSSATAGKEKTGAGVLYPFAVIKPLGLDDGCMTTLSDVNQRILKRPARPVRHPVGAFACGSVTAHGLGLSGKAIVSLTKIRTGGKGTITIIRTRG